MRMWEICMTLCFLVSLSLCLSVYNLQAVRLSVCLFIYISVSLSTIISGSKAYVSDSCRQVRRSIHPSVCLKPDIARCILSDRSCCGPRKEKRLTTI